MKKFVGAAMLAGAALAGTAGVANAEGQLLGQRRVDLGLCVPRPEPIDNDPAVQGGMDYTNGIFYAGVWGSSIDFGYDAEHGTGCLFRHHADDRPSLTGTSASSTTPIRARTRPESEFFELKVAPSICLTELLSLSAPASTHRQSTLLITGTSTITNSTPRSRSRMR